MKSKKFRIKLAASFSAIVHCVTKNHVVPAEQGVKFVNTLLFNTFSTQKIFNSHIETCDLSNKSWLRTGGCSRNPVIEVLIRPKI